MLAVGILVATPSGLMLIGRGSTFSGRTLVWETVVSGAMQAPMLGHGYGAFWQGPAGERAGETIARLIGMRINHAHNGALDLFAELGAAGVILVLVPLAIIAVAALRRAFAAGCHASIWPATYVVFFVASNVAESSLLRHKIYWALYVAVACDATTAWRPAAQPIAAPDQK